MKSVMITVVLLMISSGSALAVGGSPECGDDCGDPTFIVNVVATANSNTVTVGVSMIDVFYLLWGYYFGS